MPNRLAGSLSPYLLQHRDNPVDWWPWCDEAWEKARSEDKPVFLSVGYSSCHWCHVMAHESFEDPEVGAALNRDFVSIKLDREERPDIDEVYMTAVQLSTGHGGWPMSVFLTPDKKPFFAGTYFPRESRGDFPGFLTIVGSLAKAWREQRSEVQKSADDFASALAAALDRTLPSSLDKITVSLLDQAVELLHQDFDTEHGGFGGRPKFPPHAALRFLLDYATLREGLGGDSGDLAERAGHMALFTLERMALGGIHDHVGGGFHRYSTDDEWLLPHFEKMLYDNAQLLGAYSHAAKVVSDPRLQSLFTRTAQACAEWLDREMTGDDGLFFSALDADSDGKEGAFTVWSVSELDGAGVSAEFKEQYSVKPEGNFRDEATEALTGENVLHLVSDTGGAFEDELVRLRRLRDERTRPSFDDKAIAAWNGLTIGALAQAGLGGPAERAASRWASVSQSGLSHMVVRGEALGVAFLDDLACMADALLDLGELTGKHGYREFAERLVDQAVRHHHDPQGGFAFTPDTVERLFGRSKPYLDNVTPSPNGVLLRVFRRLVRTTDALDLARSSMGWVQRAPRGTETILREFLWLMVESEGDEIALGPQPHQTKGVSVELTPRDVPIESDGWGYAEVVMAIPRGFHVNSDEPLAQWLSPTVVTVEGAYGEASFPESRDGTYTGEARIVVRLRPKGESRDFEIKVRFQMCSETECLAPEEWSLTGRLVGA